MSSEKTTDTKVETISASDPDVVNLVNKAKYFGPNIVVNKDWKFTNDSETGELIGVAPLKGKHIQKAALWAKGNIAAIQAYYLHMLVFWKGGDQLPKEEYDEMNGKDYQTLLYLINQDEGKLVNPLMAQMEGDLII